VIIVSTQDSTSHRTPRHSIVVRVTHWVNAAGFVAFLLSGMAILLAYPRLHWGETGAVGTPASIELPLPFVLESGIRGPGRYLHFLTAWVCLLNGLAYIVAGVCTRHFREDLLPRKADLGWGPMKKVIVDHLGLKGAGEESVETYNVVQQLTYLIVVFMLFPFMFMSGLAMSPTVTSVFPWLATALGGQQSARTLHFFSANFLVLFLLVHVAMVILTGFSQRMRAMITGHHLFRRPPG
jgi:thiosulfate reductase cytochrome b subunit